MSLNNQGFKDLLAYKKAYQQACEVFTLTLSFPKEERYSLTDQIRRLSHSICDNPVEAYRNREYHKQSLLKISDCLAKITKRW